MLGLIGRKVGMTQVFDANGVLTPVTVIRFEPNVVVASRTPEKNGYSAVVFGTEEQKPARLTKPVLGQFPEGLAPTRILSEIRDFPLECKPGDKFGVEILEKSRFVDVIATSKGKGFQGVMKRWNFGGGRNTHGSKFHREPGSTGQCTYPARSFKNVKMPGRMGRERVTTLNLRVVSVDKEKNLILVRGAVPGPKGASVIVRGAVKKAR
jgi:large subunit ribosomal protein L3